MKLAPVSQKLNDQLADQFNTQIRNSAVPADDLNVKNLINKFQSKINVNEARTKEEQEIWLKLQDNKTLSKKQIEE